MQTRHNGRTRAQMITRPSGRTNLAVGSAAPLASIAVPMAAHGAPAASSADAELIALCSRVLAIRREMDAIFDVSHDKESEDRTQPAICSLYDERGAALDRINDIPGPTTLAGARAMAAAARSLLPKDLNGKHEHRSDAEWLAFTALEFLEERASA